METDSEYLFMECITKHDIKLLRHKFEKSSTSPSSQLHCSSEYINLEFSNLNFEVDYDHTDKKKTIGHLPNTDQKRFPTIHAPAAEIFSLTKKKC